MTDKTSVTGLVLAGGLARRMEGRDKGLMPLRGRPLFAHVIDRLAPQVGPVLVNANRNLEVYAACGWPVVTDVIPGFAGPLAGVHAGLQACTTPLLVTAPCDAPLLPTDLVPRLTEALGHSDARVAVARADERLQPAFLLCRRDVLGELENWVRAGGRKMQDWLAAVAAVAVPFDNAEAFANVNTAEELARLDQRMAKR